MNPKISVIVPVYMAEKYLDKCAESISGQSFENIEVILVDDGSPDNSPAMCDAWVARDGRFRVIHRENGGVSAARNTGLRAALGEYITFVDCDDWIDCDMLERLLSAAESEKAEIAACDMFLESPGESVRCPGAAANRFDNPVEAMLLDKIRPEVTAKLFAKGLLENKFFDENVKYAEDMLFCFYACCDCKRAVYAANTGYHYLQNSGNSATTPYITVPRAKSWGVTAQIVRECSGKSRAIQNAAVHRHIVHTYALLSRVLRSKNEELAAEFFPIYKKEILKYKSRVLFCSGYSFKQKAGTLALMLGDKIFLRYFTNK